MFPFTITVVQQSSPVGKLFLKKKPKEMTWYEADLEVTSPNTGVFKVFHLTYKRFDGESFPVRDTDNIEEFPVTFKTAIIKEHIEAHLTWMAQDRRKKELQAEEKRIIALYVEEERAKLGL